MAVEQEEQLGLQRGAWPLVVEIRQEWIVGFFKDGGAVDAAGQSLSPPRFADPARAIDGNV
jgi:hypothetical protein